jgi:hypothetical protein
MNHASNLNCSQEHCTIRLFAVKVSSHPIAVFGRTGGGDIADYSRNTHQAMPGKFP